MVEDAGNTPVDLGQSREEEGPVGPFPSWKWVYGTVLAYGAIMIVALWILTRLLDPGTRP